MKLYTTVITNNYTCIIIGRFIRGKISRGLHNPRLIFPRTPAHELYSTCSRRTWLQIVPLSGNYNLARTLDKFAQAFYFHSVRLDMMRERNIISKMQRWLPVIYTHRSKWRVLKRIHLQIISISECWNQAFFFGNCDCRGYKVFFLTLSSKQHNHVCFIIPYHMYWPPLPTTQYWQFNFFTIANTLYSSSWKVQHYSAVLFEFWETDLRYWILPG